MSRLAERVVAFCNKRGTCEQWIKEGKAAIKWTRLSCRTFAVPRQMFQEILWHHRRQCETCDGHAFKSNREEYAPNAKENGQIKPSTPLGGPTMPGAIHASHSCFRAIQKNVTIQLSSGFIRGIPVMRGFL
jgi:hypothetical protein